MTDYSLSVIKNTEENQYSIFDQTNPIQTKLPDFNNSTRQTNNLQINILDLKTMDNEMK